MFGNLAVCAFAAAGLAACAASAPKPPVPLPTEHFSVKVEEAPDQIALGVHAEGLSANQQTALADFIDRWRQTGGGAMLVKTPADAGDANQAKSMAYAVQAQLEVMGVPADQIALSSYQSGGGRAVILASFLRPTAKGPDCSGDWDNLTSTMNNEPYKHFGCALTANLAAQVADPRDFVTPPSLSPADNTRREVVLGKYREGKVTASDKDAQASGAVSTAVQ